MSIRAAQPTDAPFLSALLAQLGYPAQAEDMPSRLASLETFPRALALVAVDGQNVVGLITAHIIPSIHAAEPVVSDECSSGEELLSSVLGLLWVGACAYFVVAGWRGRLWGSRIR